MKGKFVTFEGGEGVGKTTQLRLVRQYLEEKGVDAIFLREPGGNDISEKIRNIILDISNSAMTGMCEAMLYSAARAQLTEEVIKPALQQGKLVVCDRFIDSTFAYQGIARGLGADKVDALNRMAAKLCPPLRYFSICLRRLRLPERAERTATTGWNKRGLTSTIRYTTDISKRQSSIPTA